MSVTRFQDLDLTRQYTYAEYVTWRFSERVELLRGWVAKISPAPSRYHQEVVVELTRLFANYFAENPCRLYTAPFDVRLPRTVGGETVVQPDVCVVCDESKLTDQGCSGAPDLVIEVLSPGNTAREMREKYALYEEVGVREYWVVEPSNHLVLRYELRDGIYVGLAPKTGEDDDIRSVIFSDLSVVGKGVFGL